MFYHTPNKTLIYVVHVPEATKELKTGPEYMEYYRTHNHNLTLTEHEYNEFQSAVILNDYVEFIEKVYHAIMSL